jgi:DNA-binding transcriptional ArsR family regulator
MSRQSDSRSLIQAVVSPRFDVFYALRALESGGGESLDGWRREIEPRLTARLRTNLASVAPTPLMWPLLADALREAPASVTFAAMIEILARMDERSFQTFVLGGVFKSPGAVDALVAGEATLARTVAAEAKTQDKLLSLLGLLPFHRHSAPAVAFERIVKAPGAYRDDMVAALDAFWSSGFSETWQRLEPQMKDFAQRIRTDVARGFAAFATDRKLPVSLDGDTLVTIRGATRSPVKGAAGVYLLPSAFNTGRLWAAYEDARGRTRFFIPVFDAGLTSVAAAAIDPALVFRALGDTTRYAIASSIARTPMTSVELARVFGVSKPTISHHVALLRSAGLLEETPGDNGVFLALNRGVLERASRAAAMEMFSDEANRDSVVKRSRRANVRIPGSTDSTEQA